MCACYAFFLSLKLCLVRSKTKQETSLNHLFVQRTIPQHDFHRNNIVYFSEKKQELCKASINATCTLHKYVQILKTVVKCTWILLVPWTNAFQSWSLSFETNRVVMKYIIVLTKLHVTNFLKRYIWNDALWQIMTGLFSDIIANLTTQWVQTSYPDCKHNADGRVRTAEIARPNCKSGHSNSHFYSIKSWKLSLLCLTQAAVCCIMHWNSSWITCLLY